MVTTQIIDIPFGLAFQLKKKEPQFGHMEIILSLKKWSITLNATMIQLSDILCGGTHHSWS